MGNITLDSTSFSEQLGIYDFFNVLLSGAIFVVGLSVINSGIYKFLWANINVQKIIGIIVLVYVSGLIMQELGSFADKKLFKFHHKATRSMLISGLDDNNNVKQGNDIVANPLLWQHYRNISDLVLSEQISENENKFEDRNVNGFLFSVFQYYVSVNGKDKKVEKMRALFSMSKILMSCFGVLSILTFLELIFDIQMPIHIWNMLGLPFRSCTDCIDKVIMSLLFAGIAVVFYFRTQKTMRYFLLILLGTYDAIVRIEKKNCKSNQNNNLNQSDNS